MSPLLSDSLVCLGLHPLDFFVNASSLDKFQKEAYNSL